MSTKEERQAKLEQAEKDYLTHLATPKAQAAQAAFVKKAQEGVKATLQAVRAGERISIENRRICINAISND